MNTRVRLLIVQRLTWAMLDSLERSPTEQLLVIGIGRTHLDRLDWGADGRRSDGWELLIFLASPLIVGQAAGLLVVVHRLSRRAPLLRRGRRRVPALAGVHRPSLASACYKQSCWGSGERLTNRETASLESEAS